MEKYLSYYFHYPVEICLSFWPAEYMKGDLFFSREMIPLLSPILIIPWHLPSSTLQDPVLNLFPELRGAIAGAVSAHVGGAAGGEFKKMLIIDPFLQDPSIYCTPASWKLSSFQVGLHCIEKC